MIKNDYEILDCTLRDGGFYTNWCFDDVFVKKYLKIINALDINHIEIGYLNPVQSSYKGEFFYSHIKTVEFINKYLDSHIKIWCMFDLKLLHDKKSFETQLNNIHPNVFGIRITVPNNYNLMLLGEVINLIKKYGLAVSVNLMYAHTYIENQAKITEIIDISNKADIISLVDSYGVLKPEEISSLISFMTETNPGLILGFHGHNNLELGFANALSANKNGCQILDGTLDGFGRGAGNVRTELLALRSDNYNKVEENQNFFEAICDISVLMETMRKKYNWGPTVPYILGASNKLPQSIIMELSDLKRFSAFDITTLARQIKNIQNEPKHLIKTNNKHNNYNNACLFIADTKQTPMSIRELELTISRWSITTIYFLGINAILNNVNLINKIKYNTNTTVSFIIDGYKGTHLELERLGLDNLPIIVPSTHDQNDESNECFEVSYTLNNPLEAYVSIVKRKAIDLVVLRGFDGDEINLRLETERILQIIAEKSHIISTTKTNYPLQEESVFAQC